MKRTLMRLAVLACLPLSAQAALESSANYWIEYLQKAKFATDTTGPAAQTTLTYSDNGPDIPLIDGSAGSVANSLYGRLAGGVSLFAVRKEYDPDASSRFESSATIGDTLRWNGQTPLQFSLDGDWSSFTRNIKQLDYGDPAIFNTASVSFSFGYYVSYEDEFGNEHMLTRRTLTRVGHQYSNGSADGFEIEHDNGVDRVATVFGNRHVLESTVGPLPFDPVEIDVQFSLSMSAECYFMAGGIVNNDATCQSAVAMWNTAYAGIAGNFTSVNGYSYRGRAAEPPNGVPEPPALALAAVALALLRGRHRRIGAPAPQARSA